MGPFIVGEPEETAEELADRLRADGSFHTKTPPTEFISSAVRITPASFTLKISPSFTPRLTEGQIALLLENVQQELLAQGENDLGAQVEASKYDLLREYRVEDVLK